MRGRIVLVVTSPRCPPGLLTWPAWQALRSADTVLAAELDEAWRDALGNAGVPLHDLAAPSAAPVGLVGPAERAGRLLEASDGGRNVAWFGSPDGDPGLTDALAEHLARRAVAGEPPEVELLAGSYDLPGARLLDLVAVMDRLRSPGGCPWDAEQTHTSLLPYLLEEAHEVIEAVESSEIHRDDAAPDRVGLAAAHLTEELGDLLLQVVFHARIAQEHPRHPFGIDDVAAGIVAKLVRRHPHVFADVAVTGAGEVARNWDEIKAQEKQREGLYDGIPASLPALARAQKMLDRMSGAGEDLQSAIEVASDGDPVAATLLDAVREASREGVDAEARLRAALRRLSEG